MVELLVECLVIDKPHLTQGKSRAGFPSERHSVKLPATAPICSGLRALYKCR